MAPSIKLTCILVLAPLVLGAGIYRLRTPAIIRNEVPDMLWMFSFTSLQAIIWKGKEAIRQIFIFLPIPVSFALEFLQRNHAIPGTFDMLDLLAYAAGWLASRITFGTLNL